MFYNRELEYYSKVIQNRILQNTTLFLKVDK